jgi:hypothetical protein
LQHVMPNAFRIGMFGRLFAPAYARFLISHFTQVGWQDQGHERLPCVASTPITAWLDAVAGKILDFCLKHSSVAP